jgi:hypothetical protein
MMAPSSFGALQLSVAACEEDVAISVVGASGTVAGVADGEEVLEGPVPDTFVAVTVNE